MKNTINNNRVVRFLLIVVVVAMTNLFVGEVAKKNDTYKLEHPNPKGFYTEIWKDEGTGQEYILFISDDDISVMKRESSGK